MKPDIPEDMSLTYEKNSGLAKIVSTESLLTFCENPLSGKRCSDKQFLNDPLKNFWA